MRTFFPSDEYRVLLQFLRSGRSTKYSVCTWWSDLLAAFDCSRTIIGGHNQQFIYKFQKQIFQISPKIIKNLNSHCDIETDQKSKV